MNLSFVFLFLDKDRINLVLHPFVVYDEPAMDLHPLEIAWQ